MAARPRYATLKTMSIPEHSLLAAEDRRQYPRRRVRLPVDVARGRGKPVGYPGYTVDFSAGGALLDLAVPCVTGSFLTLRFQTRTENWPVTRLSARGLRNAGWVSSSWTSLVRTSDGSMRWPPSATPDARQHASHRRHHARPLRDPSPLGAGGMGEVDSGNVKLCWPPAKPGSLPR